MCTYTKLQVCPQSTLSRHVFYSNELGWFAQNAFYYDSFARTGQKYFEVWSLLNPNFHSAHAAAGRVRRHLDQRE